jgi:hypothetical protein
VKPWCAKWFPRKPAPVAELADTNNPQWCAIQRQANPPPKYSDSLATLCGYWVTMTGGIERREPSCEECRALLAREHGVKPKRQPRPLDAAKPPRTI